MSDHLNPLEQVSNIHFEGARIVSVLEDGERHMLTFEVSYPMPDGGSDFPQRKFIFQLCSRYFVDEGQYIWGEPTIQRVEVMHAEPDRIKIRMHTDHGVREVTCRPNVLEREPEPTCSFCGQPKAKVTRLIASVGEVAICNYCVALSYDVLRREGVDMTLRDEPSPEQGAPPL